MNHKNVLIHFKQAKMRIFFVNELDLVSNLTSKKYHEQVSNITGLYCTSLYRGVEN